MKSTKRNYMKIAIFATLCVLPLASLGFANHGGGQCSKGKCAWKSGGVSKQGGDLEGKVFHKAHMLKENQEAAGLSDAQIEEVKTIAYNTKKKLIELDAGIESLMLDIHHEMKNKPANLETLNSLIDQKYELKKERSKTLMSSYVKIKAIPSAEQWEALKTAKKGHHSER